MSRAARWAGLGCLAALPFLPVLANGFVNLDDTYLLSGNPALRGLSAQALRWMATSLDFTTYQPLGWLLYALLALPWGLTPAAVHAAALALHGANAALAAGAAERLLARAGTAARPARLACAAAALAWAWHPLQAESVAWAVELPDLLATAFFLMSVRAYLGADAAGGPRLGLALGLFALSGLSRWKGASLPFVLLVLDLYPLRRLPPDPRRWGEPGARRVLAEKLPFLALAAAFAAANAAAKARGLEYRLALSPEGVSLQLLSYLKALLWPSGLFPLRAAGSPATAPWLGPAALAAGGGLAAAWAARRRLPAVPAALACALAALAPPLAFTLRGAWRPADHYAYLAGLSLVPAAAAGLAKGLGARGPARLLAGLLAAAALGGWGSLSWRQTRVWRDSISLWSHALAHDPRHPVARGELAVALLEADRPDEARSELLRQAAEHPEDARARAYLSALEAWLARPGLTAAARQADLGSALLNQGRFDEARARLERAASLDPALPAAQRGLGLLARLAGEPGKAERRYEALLALSPGDPEALEALAGLAMEREDWEGARSRLREFLKARPRSAGARNALGVALLRLGRPREAVLEFRRALAASPGHAGALDNLRNASRLAQTAP